MSSSPEVSSVGTENATAPNPTGRIRWFFFTIAFLAVVIVAVGFAPSFYAPGILVPDLVAAGKTNYPPYLVLHGIVLTLWFLLLLTQTCLIAKDRTELHMKLGIAGVILATVLVPLSLYVVTRSVSRTHLGALPVIGDYFILVLFAILVTLAIRNRSKSDVHKRLMLIASISITAPAIARWPGAEAALPLSVIIPHFALFGMIMAYDVRTLHHVHKATGWAVLAYVVAAGTAVPLAMSPLGHNLVNGLK